MTFEGQLKKNDAGKAISIIAKETPASILKKTKQLQDIKERYDTLKRTEAFYLKRQYKQGDYDPIGESKRKEFLATIADLLKDYEVEIYSLERVTPNKIIDRRNYDFETLIDDILLLLSWLIDNSNVNKSLSAEQIRTTAELIVEDFGMLTTEDIALVFRQAVAGQMGDIYRLDPQVIMKWIRDYKATVVQTAMEYDRRRHASIKGSPHDERVCYDQRAEEAYQAFRAKYINEQIQKKNK